MVETVSPALARRIALSAQGFGRRLPSNVGVRQLNSVVDRINLLQIDSVNVFERSHYLPVFARLGDYRKSDLDRVTSSKQMTEWWAHEAAFFRAADLPLFQWRMDDYRSKAAADSTSWHHSNQPMIEWLRSELASNGPLRASEIQHDANKRSGPWWGWSDVKIGLETLFRWGEVTAAPRQRFERVYALPEQVLSDAVLTTSIERSDAIRELVRRSAVAHGIGTAKDLGDYYRLKSADTAIALRELADSGEIVPVTVPGWDSPAWLHTSASKPRRIAADALLSPFDPVVWERARALRLFEFHYRIEIYTPEAKRIYGYYVLPVLQDDRIVGRVDLKNDRQNGVLRVRTAWKEPSATADTSARLATLLRRTADWQGLGEIIVSPVGNLADELAIEVARLP